MTSGAHKLVHSEPFLDYLHEVKTILLSALCSVMRQKLYRYTSIFSALNYCRGIFFKSLSYVYEVVRTKFSLDFWTFAIFDCNFATIVAPSSDEYENYVVHLKERSLLKKTT